MRSMEVQVVSGDSGDCHSLGIRLQVEAGLGTAPPGRDGEERKWNGALVATTTSNPARLTPRQSEVLRLIAEGLTNSQAAAQLKVSIHTIVKHRQAVMDYLHIHDTAGLTRYAIARGITLQQDASAMILKRFHTRGGYPLYRQEGAPRCAGVTQRQLEVVKLIASGLLNKQIADALKLSIKTIEHHRQAAMNRLRIHHIAGLTRYAVSVGLIPQALTAAAG